MSPRVSLRSPGAVWRVVFDGQSQNLYPPDWLPYPPRLMSGRGIPWETVAINGTSWTTLATTVTTRRNPQFDHATNTVLVMCGGTSDVLDGDTGASVYADEVAYAASAQAASTGTLYVIGTTMTGYAAGVLGPGWTGGQAQAQADHNTLVLADASNAFDGVADINAAMPDPTITTYFTDGLHYTAAGATLAASVVAPVLEALPGFPAG